MQSLIEMVSATEFKLTRGAHSMTLKRGTVQQCDGAYMWAVLTRNPMTHAYNRNVESFRAFRSLEEVERAYKSWRGISALVAGLRSESAEVVS